MVWGTGALAATHRARSVILALTLSWPCSLAGQASSAPPPMPMVLQALEGRWVGSGTLMNRPAAFTMEWVLGPVGFARLLFTNASVDERGVSTPVLAAEAIYLVRGDSASGVWMDDRPQRLVLVAALGDSSVVTRWTAETEQGRTDYVVRSPTSVHVRDFVIADGEERLFSEASYVRP